MASDVRVRGYQELIRATDRAGKDLRRETRATFRKVGDIVRQEVREELRDLTPRSPRTEQGYRTIVRTRGVSVEQTKRKTTGLRPDWAVTQVREALDPATENKEREVVEAFEDALDRVADRFGR